MKKKKSISDDMVEGLRKHAEERRKEKNNDLCSLDIHYVPMILTQMGASYNKIQLDDEIFILEEQSEKSLNADGTYKFREIPPTIIADETSKL